MESGICLNCAQEITQKFCANCGQKTDTHRIKLKHFLLHDLLHGVWHMERGILFTLRETIVRPGQAALDYIGGKRVRYYNVFYLCLLIIGFDIIMWHLYPVKTNKYSASSREIFVFMGEHIKLIILAFVPILALNAAMLFRRLKLNIAEHFIISRICLLGILVMSAFLVFFKFLMTQHIGESFLWIVQKTLLLLIAFFPVWTYYNATKNHYKPGTFFWKILLFYILMVLELLILMAIMILAVTSDSDLTIN